VALSNRTADVDALGRSLAGKRILVTGATGFIGSALSHRLLEYGVHVLALCRPPSKDTSLQEQGIELVEGDITDFPRIETILSQDVNIIFHLAAWLRGSSPQEAMLTNVSATQHLAEASAHQSVERFIYVSSIAVYGLHGDRDVDESTKLRLYGDLYGDSKILAENALQGVVEKTNLAKVIIRPGMVYGPGSPGWTRRMGIWAKSGRLPLIDGGRGTAYPIYIENLVDLIVLSAVCPEAAGEAFNAVDDGPVTLAEFEGAYMKMVPTNHAIRLPGWVAALLAAVVDPFSPGLSYRYVVSQIRGRGLILNKKAKEQLGWRPRVDLAEGLRRSEEWLHSEGIL